MTNDRLLEIYRFLLLNRLFDERLQKLYRQGKVVGGLYASTGQEAISVGSALTLQPGDFIGPMIRNVGSLLVRGVEPKDVIRQYMARATSPTGGRDGNLHFGDITKGIIGPISMLGSQIPVLAGVALGMKMRGRPNVALVYTGDGGMSMGDFHEGMNFAAVMKAPLIVILENNGYAYSTPTTRQMTVSSLAERAPAYGLERITIDGNDVLQVYDTVGAAVAKARAGGGPSMIECMTFRMRGHAEHDDMAYVPKEEIEQWRAKDPILRFERVLVERAVVDASECDRIKETIRQQLEADFDSVDTEPFPDGGSCLGGVYA